MKGFIDVDSSMFNSYRYDKSSLFLHFKNGDVYVFHNIPKKIFDSFIKGSLGSNFNKMIKDKYPFDLYKE